MLARTLGSAAVREAPRILQAYKQGRELTADIRLDYKPVVQTRYQPMERKY